MSKDPLAVLTDEQEDTLIEYIQGELKKIDEPDLSHLEQSGVLFPNRLPKHWDTLPDVWDNLMEEKGIVNLDDYELENYLEQWLRLIGYAKWVKGFRQAQFSILDRCANYVKDYIFSYAEGGREQKAAVSGAHPLYKAVLDRLVVAESKLHELSGMVWKWEGTEFAISRAISNRQGKPSR